MRPSCTAGTSGRHTQSGDKLPCRHCHAVICRTRCSFLVAVHWREMQWTDGRHSPRAAALGCLGCRCEPNHNIGRGCSAACKLGILVGARDFFDFAHLCNGTHGEAAVYQAIVDEHVADAKQRDAQPRTKAQPCSARGGTVGERLWLTVGSGPSRRPRACPLRLLTGAQRLTRSVGTVCLVS